MKPSFTSRAGEIPQTAASAPCQSARNAGGLTECVSAPEESPSSARRYRLCSSMISMAVRPRGLVRFGLDGTEYEIDLNATQAKALRDSWHAVSVLPGGRGLDSAVSPERAQGLSERTGYYRGSPVGEGSEYCGGGPWAGAPPIS